MTVFEYKVVPAPTRASKAKGVKGTPARFAHAVEQVMNEMGAEGWDYLRTDTLPVEERQGLTGKITTFQNLLVFRRPLSDAGHGAVTALIADQSAEEPAAEAAEDVTETDPTEASVESEADAPDVEAESSTEETPASEDSSRTDAVTVP